MDEPQHQPMEANLVMPFALSAATTASTSLLTTPCSTHSTDRVRSCWDSLAAARSVYCSCDTTGVLCHSCC